MPIAKGGGIPKSKMLIPTSTKTGPIKLAKGIQTPKGSYGKFPGGLVC
jgi:hypothetical protein